MKYKHIVFDIDGTLIDTEYAVLHSLQETIKGLSFCQCHLVKALERRSFQSKVCRNMYPALFL